MTATSTRPRQLPPRKSRPSPRVGAPVLPAAPPRAAAPRVGPERLISYTVHRHTGVQLSGVVAARTMGEAACIALADFNRQVEGVFEVVERRHVRFLKKEAAARCDLVMLKRSTWCPGAFDPAPDGPGTRGSIWWTSDLEAEGQSVLALEQAAAHATSGDGAPPAYPDAAAAARMVTA